MKKLPLWKQSFESIRSKENDFLYIDKTKYIAELVDQNAPCFLSRPRRFGKSLFIDTIKCLFEWKKELFEGLYIYDKWDWEVKYPVISIVLWDEFVRNIEVLNRVLENIIRLNCERNGIEYDALSLLESSPALKLKELIAQLYRKTKRQVVVLVDEYDKPILDLITNIPEATQVKDELKGFYSVLKGADEYLKFVMLTWVTKFSKVSVFSWLNNLNDITIDAKYNGICGYTYQEILDNFWPEGYLEWVDLEKMKLRYNGYSFGKLDETMYNPFWLLNFFSKGNIFENYWFQSATPTFLIEILKTGKYDFLPTELESIDVGNEIMNSFDIEKIDLITLLFQSGYLTIKDIENLWGAYIYTLWVPNEEVRSSLNNSLIRDYLKFTNQRFNTDKLKRLYQVLGEGNLDWYGKIVRQIFAGIPYTNYINNDISHYEGFYGSVLYSFMAYTGIEFIAEDFTNLGRIDFTMKLRDKVYIIELKVEKTWNGAMEQIKSKRYWEKYQEPWKQIYLVGMEFDEQAKNLGKFEWEEIKDER